MASLAFSDALSPLETVVENHLVGAAVGFVLALRSVKMGNKSFKMGSAENATKIPAIFEGNFGTFN